MSFQNRRYTSAKFVPVEIDAGIFFDKHLNQDEKIIQIEDVYNHNKLTEGKLDLETFEVISFIDQKLQRFKPSSQDPTVVFNCPIDSDSSKDKIVASILWRSSKDSSYKVKLCTELTITDLVQKLAHGLHELEKKHWANCFALNKLKKVSLLFDHAIQQPNQIGKFKINSLQALEIEPIHPYALSVDLSENKKINPNLILSSLVNATYMQRHPQESLYVKTCFQKGASTGDLDPKIFLLLDTLMVSRFQIISFKNFSVDVNIFN